MDILTDEQLVALNEAKVSMRMENEKYIRDHPELAKLTRTFVKTVLKERPTNLNEHAYKFFSRDIAILKQEAQISG